MLPLVIGTAGLAGAVTAGYHAFAPRSHLYGKTFIGTPGVGRKLALTYDDGPNDPDTLTLLEVLAKHGVKATFFLIGKHVRQRPDIVQRIVVGGHAIGNHTYHHPNLIFASERTLRLELNECTMALADAGAPASLHEGKRLFRPPFGARKPETLRVARELGFAPILWSVTCYDWKKTTADRVEAHARRQIKGGDVILMHDGGHKRIGTDRKHTVEATERILARYQAEGFEFVRVGEMG
jgi:peptidoglycan/xylan/chitin deacetylase (PgdA/CDA1 family)